MRGEGGASVSGLVGRVEGGLQGLLRELGVVARPELDEVQLRLMELEHRIKLLERDAGEAPDTPGHLNPRSTTVSG